MVVSAPVSLSGGGLRAFRSIIAYAKAFNTHLFLPYSCVRYFKPSGSNIVFSELKRLVAEGVHVAGYSKLNGFVHDFDRLAGVRLFKKIMPAVAPKTAMSFKFIREVRPEAVVSLHETNDCLYIASMLSEASGCRSLALLQLPPVYGSRERVKRIYDAYMLWWRTLLDDDLKKIMALLRSKFFDALCNSQSMRLLKRFSKIAAVSKSIPIEMGSEWVERVVALDPGVSVDEEDMRLFALLRGHVEKEDYVVFGSRPDAKKGLIEALVAFKHVLRQSPSLKFVCTGDVSEVVLSRIRRFCRRLGIEDKVIFTGFIPRGERLKIVAESRLMLYPSHVDSFSYAVLESLYLGTPVVAYRIPALEAYYDGLSGVKLVEEGNVEALTVEAINTLEGKCEIEVPRIKSWKSILDEELQLVEGLLD
jgi:glycosyltransferase involved in cell wall biosynthesis